MEENTRFGKRIIGGQSVTDDSYGFMGILKINKLSDGWFLCGATLINNSTLITAAHCVSTPKYNIPTKQLIIGLGSPNIAKQIEVKPLKVTIHPQWSFSTLENDIAVIKIPPIKISKKIWPINLATYGIAQDTNVVALGWGKLSNNDDNLSENLQKVGLVTGNPELCSALKPNKKRNSKSLLCTINSKSLRKDTCLGDSGGPLITDNGNLGKQFIGITSFGTNSTGFGNNECGLKSGYGFYTKVSYYFDFIYNSL
ncbi:hypothetical protein BB559_002015 [Furculomyces boomerangus]|uniref:Peptidase S1 domain-containing protein n=1 Tax=Furculomyces boomerangus TaxID=61424 RepID=A0A2T9YBV3_9FUNG|nr:hypothetical protein BB559_004911 [Furculomyces boomerangus]PVU97521.1 hypothetical protein BB559_002015 [Furculomyces boomerangus]